MAKSNKIDSVLKKLTALERKELNAQAIEMFETTSLVKRLTLDKIEMLIYPKRSKKILSNFLN